MHACVHSCIFLFALIPAFSFSEHYLGTPLFQDFQPPNRSCVKSSVISSLQKWPRSLRYSATEVFVGNKT